MLDARELAGGIAARRKNLDRLHLSRKLENVRPTLKCRMKLSALLAICCSRSGVVTKSIERCACRANTRVNPSGQQNCAGHSGAFVTAWW